MHCTHTCIQTQNVLRVCRCACSYSGLKGNNINKLLTKTRLFVLLASLSHIHILYIYRPGYRMCYVPWPIWYVVETTSVRMVFRFSFIFVVFIPCSLFTIDSFVLNKLHLYGTHSTQRSIHKLSSQQMCGIGLCWTLVIYFLSILLLNRMPWRNDECVNGYIDAWCRRIAVDFRIFEHC